MNLRACSRYSAAGGRLNGRVRLRPKVTTTVIFAAAVVRIHSSISSRCQPYRSASQATLSRAWRTGRAVSCGWVNDAAC